MLRATCGALALTETCAGKACRIHVLAAAAPKCVAPGPSTQRDDDSRCDSYPAPPHGRDITVDTSRCETPTTCARGDLASVRPERGLLQTDTNIRSVGRAIYGPCMAKSTRNSGKRWTPTERKELRTLADGNTPTRVIGLKLGRTENGIRAQASRQDTSLKPTNQSPYNRRKTK